MRNLSSNLLVVASLVAATGCELGEAYDHTAQPNLVVLDESTATRLTVAPDRLSISSGDAGQLAYVHAGDVIISNGPEPFLRKVISIQGSGGQLALVTEPAALTDAILNGHAHSQRDLFSEPAPQTGGEAGLIIPIDRLALNFGSAKVIEDGGIKVSLNRGTLSFRPQVDVDLQIDGGRLSHFHLILNGELEASAGVTVSADRSFNRSFTKAIWVSPPYTATQFIGTIPIVEVVRISLVLSGEVHASAAGTVDLGFATAKASLEAGASYDAGQWTQVTEPSITFQARGPSVSATATAGASLRLTTRVDVKFYDVAGPHVTVGASAKSDLTGSIANGLDWTGRVGMDASFGGDVTVLGKTLANYDRELFDLGREFAW